MADEIKDIQTEEEIEETEELEELEELSEEELALLQGEEEEEEYDPLDDFESFEDFANDPSLFEDDVRNRYNFTLETVPPFNLPPMATLVTDDLSGLSETDLRHAPSVTAIPYTDEFVPPRWVIIIEIGKELEHPRTPEHYISDIEVWRLDSEDVPIRIEHIERSWIDRNRVVLVRDYAEDCRLLIRVTCNVHGAWETRLDIKTLKPKRPEDINLYSYLEPNIFK